MNGLISGIWANNHNTIHWSMGLMSGLGPLIVTLDRMTTRKHPTFRYTKMQRWWAGQWYIVLTVDAIMFVVYSIFEYFYDLVSIHPKTPTKQKLNFLSNVFFYTISLVCCMTNVLLRINSKRVASLTIFDFLYCWQFV